MMTRRQFVMRGGLLVPAAGLLTSNLRAAAASYLPNRRKAFRGSNMPPVTTSLAVFYEADQETYADGDAVGTMTDLSGNSRNATQATAANKPTFKTSIVNARSVYRFDGVNDETKTASRTWPASLSCYAVAKQVGSGGTFQRLLELGANQQLTFASHTSNNVLAQWGLGSNTGSTGTTAFKCFSFVGTGGSGVLYSNGTAVSPTTSSSPGAVSAVLTIGAYGGGSYNGQWDVAAILLYDTNHGTTDRQSIENWLISRYGL